jgi:predicted hydrocarbon binding protein
MRSGKHRMHFRLGIPPPFARASLLRLTSPIPYATFPRVVFLFTEQAVSSIAAGKFLPNRMLFHFHQALEETAGRTATALIWNSARPRRECLSAVTDDLEKAVAFTCFSALCESIEQEYGESGARGILQRCGRAALTQTLRSTAAIVGLDAPRLRTSAGLDRMAHGLASVARLLGLVSDMECTVNALPRGYRFYISACPECLGRRSGGKICYSVGGMLRGALDWFGIDPSVPVTEVECGAGGPAGCDFSIMGEF